MNVSKAFPTVLRTALILMGAILALVLLAISWHAMVNNVMVSWREIYTVPARFFTTAVILCPQSNMDV